MGLITCAGIPKRLKCERVLTCFHEYVSALVVEAAGCSHYTPWDKASECILESPCLSVCVSVLLSCVPFWVFKLHPEDVNRSTFCQPNLFHLADEARKKQTTGPGCGVAMYL